MIKAGHSSTTSIRSPQILAANSLLIPLFKDLLGPQRSAYPSQSWLALLCPRQGLVGPLKQPHFPSQICSPDHQCLNQVVDHLRLMQMSYSFPGGFRIDIISLLTAANMLLQISKSPFLFLSTLTGNSILSHIGSNAYPKSDIKCSGQFWVET